MKILRFEIMIIFTNLNARGNELSCVAYFKYLLAYIVFYETHIPHYTLYISVLGSYYTNGLSTGIPIWTNGLFFGVQLTHTA